ncbi:hypothetical protein EON83_11170 [bacterium]|nr:MAG: hypothetical protein EON83_11170 [bacterium]
MATRYYGIDNTKQDGSKMHGAEWDFLVDLIDAQLQGVLELHGAGVVALPDANSLLVEPDTTGVSVRPGVAVLFHTVYGHVFAKVEQEETLDGSKFEEGINYVHLSLQIASVVGAPDTRATQTPELSVSDEEALDGHEPLAQVTIVGGAVTEVKDLRRVRSANQLWSRFFGAGRVTGFNRTALAAAKVADSLVLLLPEGSTWFIAGQLVTLDFDVPIPVPANRTAWGVLSLDDAGLPTVAASDWFDVEPPRGVGVVGRIVSGATSITTLDGTARDTIQTEGGKQARFEALETLVAALGAGTDPDDPDAPPPQVTVAMFNTLKMEVNGRLDAIEAKLATLSDLVGTDAPLATRLAGRVETLRAEHSRLAASVVRNSPRAALRLRSSIVVPGLSGRGESFSDGATQPASYVGGNLRWNGRRLE